MENYPMQKNAIRLLLLPAIKILLLPIASMLWLFPGVSAFAQDESIHHVPSDTCKQCHKEIYTQWKGSMHAQSTAIEDPIHGTFYQGVVGSPLEEGVKTKAGKYPVCLQCHSPNAAKDKVTKLDAKPAYAEGVNCVACHTLGKFNGTKGDDGKPRLGMKAYTVTDTLQGPQGFKTSFEDAEDMFGGVAEDDDKKPNPHLGQEVELDGETIASMPMSGNAALMKTNDACMGCHEKRGNSNQVPLCQTGDEYVEAKSEVACTSCHMPIAGGLADHSMGGGHDSAMLKRAVVFYVSSEADGENLKTVVTMENKQPHSLPTGAPFRNMYVKLTAFDASGEVLWQNAEGHPGKEDAQAYMMYELLDDSGAHTTPPKATSLGPDTRLKAFETRQLNYSIPARDVAVVRGELFYNLLWPGLVEKFTKLPEDLVAPVSIAMSEVKF